MRRHEVVVGILHLLAALFVACCVSVIWVGAALLAPTFAGTFVPDLVALFGRPVAIALLSIAAIDLVAAVMLLRGPSVVAARTLMILCVPLVFVFPIGTALAAYTWWALLSRRTTIADPDIVDATMARRRVD